MTELRKCPFCGGEARIERTDCIGSINYHYGYCIQCGARTDEYATKKGAIEAWNKRVSCDTCAMYFPDDGCMAGLAEGEVAE